MSWNTTSWLRSRRQPSPAGGSKRALRRPLFVELLEGRDVPSLLGQGLFPADYPYNQKITNAPVAANSAALINFMQNYSGTTTNWPFSVEASTLEARNNNYRMYGIPYNVVHGNSAPRVNVMVWEYGNGQPVPYTVSVPMPANPVVEGDYWIGPNPNQGYATGGRGDSHLIIWDEDNNIDYEFFGVARPNEAWGANYANAPDGTWHAGSAAIWNMKQNSFQSAPGSSGDAAGLAILPLLVRPDEALPAGQGGQGVINHAIRVTWQNAVIRDMFQYPATATADNGNNNPNMPPMGARLRLKNSFVIPASWGPESRAIAQALKDYGLIIADNGANNSGIGSSYSVDGNNTPNLYFDQGSPYDLVNGINSGAIHLSDFDFVDQTPMVTGLSQTSGKAGDSITITGQNFSYALPGQLSVLFGGTPATNVVVVNDSTITASAPAGSGAVNVQVQSGITVAGRASDISRPVFGYGRSKQAVMFSYSDDLTVPSGVTATPDVGKVTVSWSAVSGATSYNLYRGTSPGGEGTGVYLGNITGTSVSDTFGYPEYVYYYKVTAVTSNGESAPSSEVSGQYQNAAVTAQTPMTAPTPMTAQTPATGTGKLRNDYTGWVGFEFTTGASAPVVTDLGRWVVLGNRSDHTVKVVDASSNAAVASTTLNTSGATPGEFEYGAVGEAPLLARHNYYLLSQETAGGDQWYDDPYGLVDFKYHL